MNRPSLGIAINCQNEEHHLPATIAQFFPLADEIVVIDGGSTDGSVACAKRMGAKVFYQPWLNNHAFQKNLGASKLKTDWIYIHDPDERLEPTLVDVFPLLLTEDGQRFLMDEGTGILPDSEDYFDCLGIARRNFLDGEQTPIYPDYQYRLWKNNCHYNPDPIYRVHVEVEGFTKRTEIDCKRQTLETPSRFNILHYKTAVAQKEHERIFDEVLAGRMGELNPKDISRPM